MVDVLPLLPSPTTCDADDTTVLFPQCGYIRLPHMQGTQNDRDRLLFIGKQLAADLRNAGAINWQAIITSTSEATKTSEPSDADGSVSSSTATNASVDAIIDIQLDSTVPSQGYTLTVSSPADSNATGDATPNRSRATTSNYSPICVITACDFAGIRNGIQTLRQLVQTQGLTLPTLRISDQPSLAVRAYSLDISRGRIPTLAYLRSFIDTLELCKYTQLQLYVESSVAFPATQEAWKDDTPLTFSDIETIDKWCWLRGIELVPEMASFGHLYALCRTHQWRHLGEHPEQADRPFSFVERMLHHTLNPTLQQSRDFVCNRIDEYAPLFRSNQFNITSDETFDLGTGASVSGEQSTGQKPTVPQLYADFVQKICAHCRQRGLTPLMYADIPVKYPQLLPQLPHDVVFANWDYRSQPSEENVRLVAESGHDQLVCPGVQTWNRLLPDCDAAWSNISLMSLYALTYHARGLLITDWGDYGHINDPLMSLIGLGYGAQRAWSAPKTTDEATSETVKETIDHAISIVLLHDLSGTLASIFTQAGRLQSFSWADTVQWMELHEKTDDPNDADAVNPDVRFILGPAYANITSCSQARKLFIREREKTIARVGQFNASLGALIARCSRLSVGVSSHSVVGSVSNTIAHIVATFRLMMEGQILLNRLGVALQQITFEQSEGSGDAENTDWQDLARALEKWMTAYSVRWNEVSRPSHLWQVQEVVWSFVNLVRNTASNTASNSIAVWNPSWHHKNVSEIPWVINGRHKTVLSPDMTRDGLCLYWTGSGFEVDFRGPELWCEIESHFTTYEQWIVVEVDGQAVCRMPLQEGINRLPLVRGCGDSEISHIRLLKEVQAMHDDPTADFILRGLTFPAGELLAPPQRPLCFEFVGDSITSGTGAIGSAQQKSYCAQIFSAENGFPRMVADAFNARFRVISQAGWGIVCNCENDPTCTLPSIYEKTCAFAISPLSLRQEADQLADFTTEPADVVIINLGTNDATAFAAPAWKRDSSGRGEMGSSNYATFRLTRDSSGRPDDKSAKLIHDGVVSFLRMVRKHNPHAFLLWCYGMMENQLTPLLQQAVHDYQQESGDMNTDFIQLPLCSRNELGAFAHPNRTGHVKAARAIENKLEHILQTPHIALSDYGDEQ